MRKCRRLRRHLLLGLRLLLGNGALTRFRDPRLRFCLTALDFGGCDCLRVAGLGCALFRSSGVGLRDACILGLPCGGAGIGGALLLGIDPVDAVPALLVLDRRRAELAAEFVQRVHDRVALRRVVVVVAFGCEPIIRRRPLGGLSRFALLIGGLLEQSLLLGLLRRQSVGLALGRTRGDLGLLSGEVYLISAGPVNVETRFPYLLCFDVAGTWPVGHKAQKLAYESTVPRVDLRLANRTEHGIGREPIGKNTPKRTTVCIFGDPRESELDVTEPLQYALPRTPGEGYGAGGYRLAVRVKPSLRLACRPKGREVRWQKGRRLAPVALRSALE